MNQTEFCLVDKQKDNCHHDNIPWIERNVKYYIRNQTEFCLVDNWKDNQKENCHYDHKSVSMSAVTIDDTDLKKITSAVWEASFSRCILDAQLKSHLIR